MTNLPAKTPTKKENAARLRENQRRSRQRKKEYLESLETRFRECQRTGIEASIEIQNAAKRVVRENGRLRDLLRKTGLSDADIEAFVKGESEDTDMGRTETGSAVEEVLRVLGRRSCGDEPCGAGGKNEGGNAGGDSDDDEGCCRRTSCDIQGGRRSSTSTIMLQDSPRQLLDDSTALQPLHPISIASPSSAQPTPAMASNSFLIPSPPSSVCSQNTLGGSQEPLSPALGSSMEPLHAVVSHVQYERIDMLPGFPYPGHPDDGYSSQQRCLDAHINSPSHQFSMAQHPGTTPCSLAQTMIETMQGSRAAMILDRQLCPQGTGSIVHGPDGSVQECSVPNDVLLHALDTHGSDEGWEVV